MKLSALSTRLALIGEVVAEEHAPGAGAMDYNSNGKKYRLTSGGKFVRVRGEDKHLIVAATYEDLKDNLSIVSAYAILRNQGDVLEQYRDLCLAIILTAREIELNKWHDEASSMVTTLANSCYDPMDCTDAALEYVGGVGEELRKEYVNIGAMVLAATKINFFQTDHHVTSPELEGYALRRMVTETCGLAALTDKNVYNALRAFSYWISIKGVLSSLQVPGLKVDEPLLHNFKTFPSPPAWIKNTLRNRYPAGCANCAIVKRALVALAHSVYGPLIALPKELDAKALLDLCTDIENDPLRYHVRARSMDLSISTPVQLNSSWPMGDWIEFVSSILLAIGDTMFDPQLAGSSKLLALAKVKNTPLFKSTRKLVLSASSLSNFPPVANSISSQLIPNGM